MKREVPPELATLYPWPLLLELADAATQRNVERIDAVTHRLVTLGLCRRRTDASRFKPISHKATHHECT